MKNINNTFKQDIRTYGRQLDFKIKINNIGVDTDNFSYIRPTINALLFKTIMHAVKLDTKYNLNKKDKINIEAGIKVNEPNYKYVGYNSYYVYSSEREEDTLSYTVMAYDKMLESMIDYDLEIAEKITLREYLIRICEKLGWDTSNIPATFINSNKLIDPTLHIGIGYTFRDVLDEIATLSCSALVFINDILCLKYPEETGQEIDESYLNEDSITIGEKVFFNSLVFSRAEESDNIFRKDDNNIEANGLHEYRISDNQLLSTNDRDLYIDEMWEYLQTFEFYTFDIKTKGILFLEAYDRFSLSLGGQKYTTILLNDEIAFDDGLTEDIYMDAPEETQTDYKCASETDKKINKVYILVDKQNQKIESLTSEVGQYSERISTVEQTVNGITQKVESIEEFSREISSMQQLHLSDTAEGENLVLNLTIYGDTEKFKVLTPEEDLVPSEDLVPYGDTIDLIVDTQPRNNPSATAKTFEIAMKEPLRNIGQVRDELNIINNKVTITRRISNDLQVLEQEVIEELGEIKIPTYKENTYIYIREYPTLEYFCRYIIDNDYLETFATQGELQQATVQLNSKIEQTSQSILLEVSEEYVDRKKVISAIKMSPEDIKIEGNKINLKGTVTANEFFKILNDGSMEAVNGRFIGGVVDVYPRELYDSAFVRVRGMNESDPVVYIDAGHIDITGGQNSSGYNTILIWADNEDSQIMLNNVSGKYTNILPGKINLNGPVTATSFNPQSRVELKENIRKFDMEALRLINNTDIYSYNYKNDKNSKTIGLIIGDGYKTPREVMSKNEAINMYSMSSLGWKAIQELDKKIEKLIKILKKIPILGRIITKRWDNEKYIQDNIRNNRNRNDSNDRSNSN